MTDEQIEELRTRLLDWPLPPKEMCREAADALRELKAGRASWKSRCAELDTYSQAITECRIVCREIMGSNLAFVDDDVARALRAVVSERDALRVEVNRLREALRACVEKKGGAIQF